MIDLKTVREVAALARIHLNENELATFTGQLDKILTHFQTLQKVNTDAVEPTSHVLPLKNVFRPDQVEASLPQEEVVRMAPARQGPFIRVRRVIEE